jgi:topoisomerase-4 subunit A
LLAEWIAFRQATVARRTRHRLDKVLDRIHVLEGRQLVLLNIDEVIRIIRNADEPKAALIERFALSDRQADDILDIRLRQLARLEAIKIEQELKDKRDEQKKLEEILGSAAALKRTVIREIEADAKAYGDDRRTLIQEEKRAVAEVKVVDEPVTVVASLKGWVRALKGHEVDPGGLAFKAGDGLYGTFACRSVDTLAGLRHVIEGKWPRVQRRRGHLARRPRRRRADHDADRPRARHADRPLLGGCCRPGAAAGQYRRLRPAGPRG